MVEISRRRAIEDVASDLFRANGYAATSIRDIARALDLQGPSLYAHVTSKEEVLWAIVDRAAARFESAADAADAAEAASHGPWANGSQVGAAGTHASAGGDAEARLAALVRAHVAVIVADAGAAGVFVHEWRALGEDRRAAILSRRDAYERRFRAVIEEGVGTGVFVMTDAGLAATAILAMLNGIPGWYDPAGRLSPDRIADHFADFALRMLQGADR